MFNFGTHKTGSRIDFLWCCEKIAPFLRLESLGSASTNVSGAALSLGAVC